MGPSVVQLGDGTVDHRAPLVFDAKSIAADDLANLVRRHSILSRSLQNGGKRSWRDGYDRAGAAFAEQRVFGCWGVFEFDVCAKLGRSIPSAALGIELRPYR